MKISDYLRFLAVLLVSQVVLTIFLTVWINKRPTTLEMSNFKCSCFQNNEGEHCYFSLTDSSVWYLKAALSKPILKSWISMCSYLAGEGGNEGEMRGYIPTFWKCSHYLPVFYAAAFASRARYPSPRTFHANLRYRRVFTFASNWMINVKISDLSANGVE